VVLRVKEHPLFQREGYDIGYRLPVNVAQAALGAKISVPTLEGDSEIEIPQGVQTGHTIRLRGKGVPHMRGSQRGDQLITLVVRTPDKLNDEQRRLFEELARSFGEEAENGTNRHEKNWFNKIKDAFAGDDE
jgi:molecular chaperone DnaJ